MKHLEDNLQIAVANYLKLQYPGVLFCHIPNGGNRSAREGARFKAMGIKPGMPDVMIFKSVGNWAGLAIELKVKPNKVQLTQLECLKALAMEAWKAEICWSFEEAKNVIDCYMEKPKIKYGCFGALTPKEFCPQTNDICMYCDKEFKADQITRVCPECDKSQSDIK